MELQDLKNGAVFINEPPKGSTNGAVDIHATTHFVTDCQCFNISSRCYIPVNDSTPVFTCYFIIMFN
jgi:hypothetical protein